MSTFVVKCPSCGTANRVPGEKEGVPGHCGNCRGALPPLYYQPQQVDDHSFDSFVAGYHGPILAEFWAPW